MALGNVATCYVYSCIIPWSFVFDIRRWEGRRRRHCCVLMDDVLHANCNFVNETKSNGYHSVPKRHHHHIFALSLWHLCEIWLKRKRHYFLIGLLWKTDILHFFLYSNNFNRVPLSHRRIDDVEFSNRRIYWRSLNEKIYVPLSSDYSIFIFIINSGRRRIIII